MVSITEQGVGDEHLQNFKIYLSRVSKEACVRAEWSSSRENVLKVGCYLMGGLREEMKDGKEMKEGA